MQKLGAGWLGTTGGKGGTGGETGSAKEGTRGKTEGLGGVHEAQLYDAMMCSGSREISSKLSTSHDALGSWVWF